MTNMITESKEVLPLASECEHICCDLPNAPLQHAHLQDVGECGLCEMVLARRQRIDQFFDGRQPKPGRQFPGVGVGAVVIRDERLLMVRRAGAHGAGQWSVPGGWVEMWEDPFEAAERETAEETGVMMLAEEQMFWTSDLFHDDGIHSLTLWIRCNWHDGEPTIAEPDKCPEVRWVPCDEVGDLPLFQPLGDIVPSVIRAGRG